MASDGRSTPEIDGHRTHRHEIETDNDNTTQAGEKQGEYVAKVVHTDGTVDLIDAKAIGGEYDEMPKGYFRSPSFIGTVTVCGISRWPRTLGGRLPT